MNKKSRLQVYAMRPETYFHAPLVWAGKLNVICYGTFGQERPYLESMARCAYWFTNHDTCRTPANPAAGALPPLAHSPKPSTQRPDGRNVALCYWSDEWPTQAQSRDRRAPFRDGQSNWRKSSMVSLHVALVGRRDSTDSILGLPTLRSRRWRKRKRPQPNSVTR
jgi:hypothetical protein